MTIWYVTMQFPAPSETFAAVELRALQAQGVDVAVHSLRPRHPKAAAMIEERSLESIPLSHGSLGKFLTGCWAGLIRAPAMVKLLVWVTRHTWRKPREWGKSLILAPLMFNLYKRVEDARPDVVHLFWGHYPAMLGHLLSRYCPDVVLSMFLGAYDLRLDYAGSIETACQADVVWTHAQCNVRELERRGIPADRIRLSYRGVDLSAIAAEARPKIPRRIVSAGRLMRFKGMDRVLDVFALVHRRCLEASLVIVGDGPERATLEKQAQTLGVAAAVTFTGHIPHARVFAELQQAEIFLFLSCNERIPNVVKEAMAARCLCLVSSTPGIEELIQSGENGFVVSNDLGAIAKCVIDLFKQREVFDAIAARGEETVREKFDVARNTKTYLEVWTSLVQNRRRLENLEGGLTL